MSLHELLHAAQKRFAAAHVEAMLLDIRQELWEWRFEAESDMTRHPIDLARLGSERTLFTPVRIKVHGADAAV